ncbi:MAG: HIT family protein [Rhodospirillales bacterium]
MFELHPTLENDSLPAAETDGLLIRLVNDARFPWLLIVPKVDGITELHELTDAQYADAMGMARSLGKALKTAFGADKINTAALGNMVPQLHIHLVVRTKGDDAWPGPVWGVGAMVPMSDEEATYRIELIRRNLP